jgi:hypothetical protein
VNRPGRRIIIAMRRDRAAANRLSQGLLLLLLGGAVLKISMIGCAAALGLPHGDDHFLVPASSAPAVRA